MRRPGALLLSTFAVGCADATARSIPADWGSLLAADTVEVLSDRAGAVQVARARGDTTPDGATAVLDAFSGRVSLYDRAGRVVEVLTRVGGGPAELRSQTASVYVYRDGFVVADDGALLRFRSSGEFVERTDVRRLLGKTKLSRGRDWDVMDVADDGTVLLYLSDGLYRRGEEAEPRRTYLRGGPGDWSWETLAVVDLSGYGGPLDLGGLESAHILPVRWHALVRSAGGGRLVVADRTPPRTEGEAVDSIRLRRVDGPGDSTPILSIPYAPLPFPREYADSVLREELGAAAAMMDTRPGDLLTRHRSQFEAPSSISPLLDMVVGADGTIWLAWGEVGDTVVTWLRVSGTGRPAGHVALPSEVAVVAARHEELWLRDRDELGVPRFTRVRVGRPASGRTGPADE